VEAGETYCCRDDGMHAVGIAIVDEIAPQGLVDLTLHFTTRSHILF
jgi:hypothetical protein